MLLLLPLSPLSSLLSAVLFPHSLLLLLFSHGFVFDSSVRFAFARRLFATFTCCVFCVAYAGDVAAAGVAAAVVVVGVGLVVAYHVCR